MDVGGDSSPRRLSADHSGRQPTAQRRISDAIYRRLVADAEPVLEQTGASPGGHCGASLTSSAVDSHPLIDTSDQPLPDPRTQRYARPQLPERGRLKRPLDDRGEPERRKPVDLFARPPYGNGGCSAAAPRRTRGQVEEPGCGVIERGPHNPARWRQGYGSEGLGFESLRARHACPRFDDRRRRSQGE